MFRRVGDGLRFKKYSLISIFVVVKTKKIYMRRRNVLNEKQNKISSFIFVSNKNSKICIDK